MWNSYEAADNSGCIVIFETRCLFHLDSPKVSGLNSEKPDRPGSLKSNLGKEAKCAQQFDTWQQDRQQLQVSWKKQPACCTSREAHTIMLKWVAGAKTMRILIVCHLQAGAHGNHCYSSSPNLKAKELEEPDISPGLNPKNQDQRCQCLRAKIKCPSSSRNQIHSSSAFYSI